MRATVELSTELLTARSAHRVGMLVSVGAPAPVDRPRLNVALVLDRSGSMMGAPLAAAKEAAIRFARCLGPQDRIAVVAYGDDVVTVYGPAPGGSAGVEAAIRPIAPGGITNLSGGWLKGRKLVHGGLVTGTNRIVLLTDGLANAGIVDPYQLTSLAHGALEHGISTTSIGFGPRFSEDLLVSMARAGGGNFWYVEEVDQMGGIFQEEIEGLEALVAQNLEVEIDLVHPRVQGVTLLQDYPTRRTQDGGWQVTLGDLLATSPRELGIVFHVDDAATLGEATLGQVRVSADHLRADGVDHRVVTMPVVATLDGQARLKPEIERTLVRFQAARTRTDAVRAADEGRYAEAARLLRQASDALNRMCPEAAEEIEDLLAEAGRIEDRHYDSRDRKYHLARGSAVLQGRHSYLDKLSRRRRAPDPDQG
jgi:Ca-activated chloride channel homolog